MKVNPCALDRRRGEKRKSLRVLDCLLAKHSRVFVCAILNTVSILAYSECGFFTTLQIVRFNLLLKLIAEHFEILQIKV